MLSALSSNKATGIDKISCKIIKIAAPAITDSLTYIFNQAITLSSFPDDWQMARVIPLYKDGHRNIPGNYRPISILPTISKIMERILYNQLYDYLTEFKLLSNNQFGFQKSHSTATALLDCTNEWYVNIDKKMFNLVVFIDLKFDTVNHDILLKKLEFYGITGQAHHLLKSYLSIRRQVSNRQFYFITFDKMWCTTRFYFGAFTVLVVYQRLTQVPQKYKTSANPQMIRNASNAQPNILIENKQIQQVNKAKTLGIIIDQHLSWKPNTENICKKITSGISALRRVKPFIAERDTLTFIYNVIVRPYFDYCSEVWDVFGEIQSKRLQKLQNRAARIISNMSNDVDHSIALCALGWEPLDIMRKKAKARMMYKTLNKTGPESLTNLFCYKNEITDYKLRNILSGLCLPQPRTNNMKNSFMYDGAKLWNSIPNEIRESQSLSSFQKKIAAHIF